jgi:hypothetical protein
MKIASRGLLFVLVLSSGVGAALAEKRARAVVTLRGPHVDQCPDRFTESLRAAPGVLAVDLERASGRLTVDYDPDRTSGEALMRHVKDFKCP